MAAYHGVYGLVTPACTPGSVPGLTLGNEYGRTLTFLIGIAYTGETGQGAGKPMIL